MKNARHATNETHAEVASATPAKTRPKPKALSPGSPSTARHLANETHPFVASAASTSARLKPRPPVSRPTKTGRQLPGETQTSTATSTPALADVKPMLAMPGSLSSTIEAIRAHHRERRFAMGIQQVLDRKLESYIRINKTEWHVGDDEATRDKANKDVAAKIKAARAGDGDPSIITVVGLTDNARAPADAERARHEKEMETLARSLPVAPWVETVPGLGYLGLATIIAETGDLSLYANVAKVWKRLGYAPYNGKAGSTWKRATWRNGDAALTADQWIENPFSGKRYALMHVIAVWLKNKQWIGAAKTEDGVGKPNGIYGEVYARRRDHTVVTHADWSKQHSHMDALRVMMKEVLKDLWLQWHKVERTADGRHHDTGIQFSGATAASQARFALKSTTHVPGSTTDENGRQPGYETQGRTATATSANFDAKPALRLPGSTIENARHHFGETQTIGASATLATVVLKSADHVPGSFLSENGRAALNQEGG